MSANFVQLGSVAEFINGAAFKPEDWNGSGARIIRIQNLTDPSKPYNRTDRTVDDKLRVRPGELLVSWSATLGVFEWIGPDDGVLNQHIFRVVPDKNKVAKSYLRHALKGALIEMQRHLHGATMQHVNRGEFLATKLFLPALVEQRRIAEVLDRAEALRAKRRSALAQLDTLTQSIFLDLFGDPVVNPKQWPNPTLGGLLTFQQYGPRFYNESYSVDGIRIVRITDLDEAGNLNFSEMPRLAVSDADREKYALHAGDLIFARSGATVGKVALITPDDPPCIAGAYFITMRFAKTVEPVYARAVLIAPSIRAIVTKLSRQAAQQNFSGPGLRRLPMPLPPIELQRDFASRVAAVEKLKAADHVSLAELDALFGALQFRAFRGDL